MRIGVLVLMVGALLLSSAGSAQAQGGVPAPASELVDRWYGAPIFLADGAAYAAMITGYLSDQPNVVIGGVATYVVSGPLTHLAYGHYERAGSSLLLRIGVPLAAALYSVSDCEGARSDCKQLTAAIGGLSLFVATVLDGAVFANDQVRRRPRKLLPTLSVNRDGAVLGAVGLF